MQIGSFPLLRRTLDKALLEQSNLFAVFPACNVMVGEKQHTPSRAAAASSRMGLGAANAAAARRDATANSPCALHLLSTRFVRCQFWTAPSAPFSFFLPMPLRARVELLSFGSYGNLTISCPSEKCSRDLHSQSPVCRRIKHPCFAEACLPPAPPPPPAPSLSRKGSEICFDFILQVLC